MNTTKKISAVRHSNSNNKKTIEKDKTLEIQKKCYKKKFKCRRRTWKDLLNDKQEEKNTIQIENLKKL